MTASAILTDADIVQRLEHATIRNDVDAILACENEILARMNVPLDETEQGLTEYAESRIRAFIEAHS